MKYVLLLSEAEPVYSFAFTLDKEKISAAVAFPDEIF